MKAITLHQPYASLIAIGAKPFETRSFPPPAKLIGQRIAIHAAKADHSNRLLLTLGHEAISAIIDALEVGGQGHRVSWSQLPHGAVVCTAVMAGAYHVFPCLDGGIKLLAPVGMGKPLPAEMAHHTDHFGDYSPGRWCWQLTDVQVLPEPVPAKGKQGWWEWEGLANG
ncbi:hypothetical protein H261_03388 [Paramagnetospirillum caucaseum]|uniref:ASCH domain-containing protein n=1 Tax=Paramagnetospirillum caucaseum TaxID=1244869 RepID=M2ZAI6_9PROT|nr:hypothetical protein [Paramagnetospirillum caucaseum]EME71420.1 hypothetical protein H261_03388 [Paramagnetospirillum caucaseum]